MKEFIFANENIVLECGIIKKYEIGIVISKNKTSANIQFVNVENIVELPNSKITFFDPSKTGDNFDKKVCNRCNRLLPTKYFQKNQNGKGDRAVRRPSCNDCRAEIDGVDVSTNDAREWGKIKPNFEIWKCPICNKNTIPGLTSKVVLDHDHLTGKPRAWICDSCNTGLGRFKDDIETLKNAINYLEKSKNIKK